MASNSGHTDSHLGGDAAKGRRQGIAPREGSFVGVGLLLLMLVVFMLVVGALRAGAQDTASPFSRFGYGLLRSGATAAQQQMGGTGYAMADGRQVNFSNPASYAHTDTLTFLFDFGLDYTNLWSADASGAKSHGHGGGLDYITMQFPVWTNVGMSLGLTPYSSVGYSFGSTIENGSSSYEGVGGLNLLYLGAAWSPVKGLSAGFNFAYLFGTNYNDVYARTDAGSTSLYEQILQVRDFHFDVGVQYTRRLGRRNKATVGVVYSPRKDLLGHTWIQKYDVGSDAQPDTVAGSYTRLRGRFALPNSVGVGVSWEWDDRLFAEVDYQWQGWGSTKFDLDHDFTGTRLCDRHRLALGASWRTAERGNYFKRITWRAGFRWERDYIMIGDNHVRDMGVSLGFGLPTVSTRTMINLGFEWLRRSCTPSSLLKEDYFNIRLGINFNQTWFMKSKIR